MSDINQLGVKSVQNCVNGNTLKMDLSHENISSAPIESIQEYQDSDTSSSCLCLKNKRRSSYSILTHEKQNHISYQMRSHPCLTDDISSESSNSYQNPPLKSITFQNSTLTSDIYRSESYQLLMNKKSLLSKSTSKLRIIEETGPVFNDVGLKNKTYKIISNFVNNNTNCTDQNFVNSFHVHSDTNDSSNISLPTSPVFSVVENISISKSLLSSMDVEDFILADKMENMDDNDQIMLNELMTSDMDVPMPLMEREYGIETSCHDGMEYHYNLSIPKTKSAPVSESLLNKINTVNMEDPTLSDSLNVKLKKLLLESAKKNLKDNDTISNEREVPTKNVPETKKIKSRKRSSTPRKRQSSQKFTLADTEPCIEEEFMESCSHIGRKNCPPIILISDQYTKENEKNDPTEKTECVTKAVKRRKKKDIIKVKIIKPKPKVQGAHYDKKNKRKSNFSDSGINDTESGVIFNEDNSVDLIHNHSDTCLNAHECMVNSIEIVENSSKSIISLNSDSAHSDMGIHTYGNIPEDLTHELFNSDAQDGSDVAKEFDTEHRRVDSATATMYHTPQGSLLSPNSLITNDLSDEMPEIATRNTGWYLFSEEETSNTNFLSANKNSEAIGCGARLEEIFPLTCAVPNLSTITEISSESKRHYDDTYNGNNFDSPSIFNTN